MRRFYLYRLEDVSGISGEGRVADGVVFSDGTTVIQWAGSRPSTVVWRRLSDAEDIHGHGGKTVFVWIDPDEEKVPAPSAA